MPEDSGEDSFSLAPLLFGRGSYMRKQIVHHSLSGVFAIRKGNWKLILGDGSGGFSAPRGSNPTAGRGRTDATLPLE